MKKLFFVCYTLILSFTLIAQNRNPEITKEELSGHVSYLASDELEGRGTGTPGIEKAAKYIANEFKVIGLKPIGDTSYFQYFEFNNGVKIEKNNELNFTLKKKKINLIKEKDFLPLSFSANGSIEGELVFAGYGISSEKLNYDDYKNIDANGKIVVVMRYSPDGDMPRGKFAEYSSLRYKANYARDAGAKGLIIVTVPDSTEEDKLIKLDYEQSSGNSTIQIVSIKYEKLNSILEKVGLNLKEIKKKIDASKTPNSFPIKDVKAKISVELKLVKNLAFNVVGLIEGSDSQLKNEYIVIGGHYDHLGTGSRGSLSGNAKGEIHNGADDNASGTSAVIELAEKLYANKDKLRRSVIVAAFTAEEMGLLGSSHFVNHSPIELSKINTMLNFDMVGRLDEKKGLIINGIGSSPDWKDLITKVNTDTTFKINFGNEATGGSDHSSFYFKNIPVLFFFTGIHQDYHKPTDDFDKIIYSGMEKVSNLAYNIISEIDSRNEKITFSKVKVDSTKISRMNSRVYVGIMPDFQENPDGFKISGVTDGSPAQKGGLKAGDIIIRFGDKEVKNIQDYMFAMQQYKSGEQVDIIVIREENGEKKKVTIKVTLASK